MSISVLLAAREFLPVASLQAAGLVPAGGQHGMDRAEELLGLWELGGESLSGVPESWLWGRDLWLWVPVWSWS